MSWALRVEVFVLFCTLNKLSEPIIFLIMGSLSGTCEIVEVREDRSIGKGAIQICQSKSQNKMSEKKK